MMGQLQPPTPVLPFNNGDRCSLADVRDGALLGLSFSMASWLLGFLAHSFVRKMLVQVPVTSIGATWTLLSLPSAWPPVCCCWEFFCPSRLHRRLDSLHDPHLQSFSAVFCLPSFSRLLSAFAHSLNALLLTELKEKGLQLHLLIPLLT